MSVAEQVADSRPMTWVARAGLTARGIVYVLMGVLALLVARGGRAHVDQKGALAEVLAKPFGGFVVTLLAVGFAAYALWRLSEAIVGVTGEGDKKGPRVQSFARAVVYSFLAFTAVDVLQGSREAQSNQQSGYAAKLMAEPGGRWAVGLVGLVIAAAGIVMVIEGIKLKFMRFFPAAGMPQEVRKMIRQLGRIGTIARGAVFALTGILVIVAAVKYDAAKARGLDGALKTLRDRPYGGQLLALVAAGLIVFGIYGLGEARYRKV